MAIDMNRPAPLDRRMVSAWMLVALAGLGACQNAPRQPTPDAPPPAAPEPPAPPPPETQPAAPLEPLPAGEIRAALDTARNLLDQGQEDQARDLLRRILATEPNRRLAHDLLEQITVDPTVRYGAESTPYRVVAGDTLGSIAARMMKDGNQFYGLARYNGIAVPRQVQAGQVIRIPGKVGATQAPSTGSSASPSEPTAPRQGPAATPPAGTPSSQPPPPLPPSPPSPLSPPPPAPPPVPEPSPAATPVPPPPSPVDRKRRIEQCTRDARRARERQDVCGAIRNWECVLEIDPANATARTGLDSARALKDRLPGLAC